MNRTLRRAAGLALALALTASIAALSRVPYTAAEADHALIRLSWRTPGAYVEECRRPSAEELERLPAHMRREEICEGRVLPYRLRVLINGRVIYDEMVRPSGAREDRPLYVYRELPVRPGDYGVEISWEREDVAVFADSRPPTPVGEPGESRAGRARSGPTATPERLRLSARLALEPGDIALLTYDVDRQRLVARGRGVVGE
jgi:hypothetical protein